MTAACLWEYYHNFYFFSSAAVILSLTKTFITVTEKNVLKSSHPSLITPHINVSSKHNKNINKIS